MQQQKQKKSQQLQHLTIFNWLILLLPYLCVIEIVHVPLMRLRVGTRVRIRPICSSAAGKQK